MANDFFKNGDKAYSENLNDGILVGNAFDWTVDISLPTDTGSVFPSSSDVVKAKVADLSITPNSNLSIGSTISNSSSSSQVYRLTVYPNFNRFGGFKSISLTADSGVTFFIANKGGNSPIVNNLDYSDLGNVPELKVLKEYDIVVTIPKNKGVTGLSFVFQSSSADVNGSIDQANVSGLSSRLTSIESKDTTQDGRLDSLETSTDNVMNIDLVADNNLVRFNTTVTLTVTVSDINGNPIPNKTLDMKKNNVVIGTVTTNNDGVGTYLNVLTTREITDFSVGDAHTQITVYGFEKIKDHDSGRYHLWADKFRRVAMLELTFDSETITTGDVIYQASGFIPSDYKPPLGGNIVSMLARNYNLMCYIWSNEGTVGIANKGSTINDLTLHNVIQWSY